MKLKEAKTDAEISSLDKAFALARTQGSRSPSQQGFQAVLSEERFSKIHETLSIVAQKAYQAVPVKTAWSIGNIMTEMSRKGFNHERNTVQSALDELKHAGVVTGSGAMYVRVKISGAKEKMKPEKKLEIVRTDTPIDRLFEIVSGLEAQHQATGQLLAEFRELSLTLYEEFETLRKQAEDAERNAKERIMKKFLEA